jgi:hypothetical protein
LQFRDNFRLHYLEALNKFMSKMRYGWHSPSEEDF